MWLKTQRSCDHLTPDQAEEQESATTSSATRPSSVTSATTTSATRLSSSTSATTPSATGPGSHCDNMSEDEEFEADLVGVLDGLHMLQRSLSCLEEPGAQLDIARVQRALRMLCRSLGWDVAFSERLTVKKGKKCHKDNSNKPDKTCERQKRDKKDDRPDKDDPPFADPAVPSLKRRCPERVN